MGKLGTFFAGAVTGVVGLGITAFLVDKYCNAPSCSYDDSSNSYTDEKTEAKDTAENGAENSSLFNEEEQNSETFAVNDENKNTAEPFEKIAEAIVEAMTPTQTAQNSN